MTRTLRALALTGGLAGALMTATALTATPAMAQQADHGAMHMMQAAPSLTLSAHGETKIAPDMATINFGVMTEATTASEAMSQNAERMTRVVAALRRAGIEDRHIQTSGLNLSPQYDYRENQPPLLRAYQAMNRVTVTINDLTAVGSTADAVVAAGVNQIDGIGFGLRDPKAAEDLARQEAVRALQSKARLYAQALGVQLGGIRSLSEGGGYSMPEPRERYRMAAVGATADSMTQVSGGELTVRIDITGVYDLVR